MEKFDWEEDSRKNKSLFSITINVVFNMMKKIDRLNDREFPLTKSTMVVALKGVKK